MVLNKNIFVVVVLTKFYIFFFEVEAIIKGKKHTVSIYQSPLHLGLFSLSMEVYVYFNIKKYLNCEQFILTLLI